MSTLAIAVVEKSTSREDVPIRLHYAFGAEGKVRFTYVQNQQRISVRTI